MQVVKKQLKRFVSHCANDDEYKRKLDGLILAAKSESWKTVIELLWGIKNEMAAELLTNVKYTNLSESEKDRIQAVYHNISEWIDFLTNPRSWVQKKGLIQIFNFKGDHRKPEKKGDLNG